MSLLLYAFYALSTLSLSFSTELVKFPGDYNPSARVLPTKMFDVKPASETCPLSPPAELLVSSLTQEWEGGEVGGLGEPPKLFQLKGSGDHEVLYTYMCVVFIYTVRG